MSTAKNKKINLRALCVTAVMSAIGAILMAVEFPIPIMPSFIKLDFSELPALITAFAFGPQWGVLCCLVKNLIHLPFGSTYGIGELSNFLLGAAMTFTAGMIYKYRHNKKWAAIASVLGSVAGGAVSLPINYFLIYPLYLKLYEAMFGMTMEQMVGFYSAILPSVDSLLIALIIFNVPFTAAKFLIDSVLCILIYKPLSPLIKGKNAEGSPASDNEKNNEKDGSEEDIVI